MNSQGVSTDGAGYGYLTGLTNEKLGAQKAGVYDAYLAKYFDFPGDFNRDGTVDARDYVMWRDGLGWATLFRPATEATPTATVSWNGWTTSRGGITSGARWMSE